MSAPLNITETLICDQLNIHLTECVLWKQVQGDVKSNLLLDWASSSLVRAGFSPSQVSVLFKLLCETDNSALLLWIRGNGEFSTSVYSRFAATALFFSLLRSLFAFLLLLIFSFQLAPKNTSPCPFRDTLKH